MSDGAPAAPAATTVAAGAAGASFMAAFTDSKQKLIALLSLIGVVIYLINIIADGVGFGIYIFGLVISVFAFITSFLCFFGAWKKHALALWICMVAFALFTILHIGAFISIFTLYSFGGTLVVSPFAAIMTALAFILDAFIAIVIFLYRDKNLNPNAVLGGSPSV